MQKTICFILLSFLIFSCDKEEFTPFIEPDLEKYVDRFFEEAEQRGIFLSKENLEVLFVDKISKETSFSVCGYGFENRVEILNNGGCWHDHTDIEKENFMFHELGHTLLNRLHTDVTLTNGYPGSIMCSFLLSDNCSNFQVYYRTDQMRTYYLDELFDQKTPKPTWTLNDNFIRIVFSDSIGDVVNGWEHYINKDEDNLSGYDFFIDSTGAFTASNSLGIVIGKGSIDGSLAFWLHRFEIYDFPDCSGIKARAEIRTQNLTDGFVDIGISLREYNDKSELYRFMFHRFRKSEFRDMDSEVFETEIYCIPLKSDVVTISFLVQSKTAATVYIDNVVLELWN